MTLEGSSLAPVLAPLEEALKSRRWTVAVAESCTGGLLAAALTDLPGSSEYFLGGVVTYANEAKMKLLAVSPETLDSVGAVSEEVARQMAEAVCGVFGSDLGLSVTGIAGPNAEGPKPVGLTYIGAHFRGRTIVREYRWPAGRAANRVASVEAAIQLGTEILSTPNDKSV
jgi:nicotinamide-nucleotide amidase